MSNTLPCSVVSFNVNLAGSASDFGFYPAAIDFGLTEETLAFSQGGFNLSCGEIAFATSLVNVGISYSGIMTIPLIVTTVGSATDAVDAANNTINPTTTAVNTLVNTTVPAIQASATTLSGTVSTLSATVTSLQTAVGALGSSSNSIYLSTFAGISLNTNIDSFTGLTNAFASAASTGKTLVIDCPVYMAQGTNWLKQIFIGPNVTVVFTGTGQIIYDGVGVGPLVFYHARNTTIYNLQLKYIGNPGASPYYYSGGVATFGAITGGSGYTNGTYNYVALTGGAGNGALANITVSGGAVTACTLAFQGQSYAAGNSLGASTIPGGSGFAVTIATVTSTPTLFTTINNVNNVSYLNYLTNLYVAGVSGNTFSGGATPLWATQTNTLGAIQIRGDCFNLRFIGGRIYVPDAATASQLVQVAVGVNPDWTPGLAVTASTPQNSTNLVIPTNVLFQDFIFDGYCMGVVGQGVNFQMKHCTFMRYSDFQAPTSIDPNGYLVGSSGYWFAPPHAFYFATTGVYNISFSLDAIDDLGIRVGLPIQRSTGSGFLTSFKGALANGSTIRGYRSFRIEGGFQLTAGTTALGYADQLEVYFNSTACLNNQSAGAGASPGILFPSSSPLLDVTVKAKIVDQAPVPAYFPLGSDSTSGHTNLIVDFDIVGQDWPATNYSYTSTTGATSTSTYASGNSPGFGFGGTGNIIKARVLFVAMTNTAQNTRGVIANAGSTASNYCKWEVEILGWRTLTGSNLDAQKSIITITKGAVNNTNYIKMIDVNNQYVVEVKGAKMVESWTQDGIFTPTAGATYSLPGLTWPTNFSFANACYNCTTSFTGPTSINFGDGVTAAKYLTGVGTGAGANPFESVISGSAITNAAVVATATGGNFTGTGAFYFAIEAQRASTAG